MTVAEAREATCRGPVPRRLDGPEDRSRHPVREGVRHQVLITDVEVLREALDGKNGTVIVPT
jgi:hypothetical protein